MMSICGFFVRRRKPSPDPSAHPAIVERPRNRRAGGIRTHDLFVPNEARYQTALQPACRFGLNGDLQRQRRLQAGLVRNMGAHARKCEELAVRKGLAAAVFLANADVDQ